MILGLMSALLPTYANDVGVFEKISVEQCRFLDRLDGELEVLFPVEGDYGVVQISADAINACTDLKEKRAECLEELKALNASINRHNPPFWREFNKWHKDTPWSQLAIEFYGYIQGQIDSHVTQYLRERDSDLKALMTCFEERILKTDGAKMRMQFLTDAEEIEAYVAEYHANLKCAILTLQFYLEGASLEEMEEKLCHHVFDANDKSEEDEEAVSAETTPKPPKLDRIDTTEVFHDPSGPVNNLKA